MATQNKKLVSQNEEILAINDRLKDVNKLLEEKVQERTAELENQNRQLSEYAFINAHLLRGPLSSILGVVHLLKGTRVQAEEKELMLHLDESCKKLDQVINNINKALDSGHKFSRTEIEKLTGKT